MLPSGLEVDIVIPQLKFAIEINCPVHYFPLFGEQKLVKIQSADTSKQIEIQAIGYHLLVIDISAYGYFKRVKVVLDAYYGNCLKPLIKL